jgi:hypothetical protein
VKVGELFTLVVQTYGYLFPGELWLSARLRFLSGHPLTMSWKSETWALLKGEMERLTGFLETNGASKR